MKTLNLAEAAAFLRCHPEWLRQQAKSGRISAAKPGKTWLFIDDDLAAYLRSHYAGRRQMARVEQKETGSCRSIVRVKADGANCYPTRVIGLTERVPNARCSLASGPVTQYFVWAGALSTDSVVATPATAGVAIAAA